MTSHLIVLYGVVLAIYSLQQSVVDEIKLYQYERMFYNKEYYNFH